LRDFSPTKAIISFLYPQQRLCVTGVTISAVGASGKRGGRDLGRCLAQAVNPRLEWEPLTGAMRDGEIKGTSAVRARTSPARAPITVRFACAFAPRRFTSTAPVPPKTEIHPAGADPISRVATSGPMTLGALAAQPLPWRQNTVSSHLLRHVLPYTRVVLAALHVWA